MSELNTFLPYELHPGDVYLCKGFCGFLDEKVILEVSLRGRAVKIKEGWVSTEYFKSIAIDKIDNVPTTTT